jgi:dTMP kinase
MMVQRQCLGQDLLGITEEDLPGLLVVVEGTDGVGRSTQIALLREWLEAGGYAVASTGMKRSALAGKGLDKAQQGHTLGTTTSNLFYATDFADRLEKTIIPALRAGFVVLTDRYIYSMIARAVVRGVDPQWIRDVFGFALVPDAVFYLTIDLPHLIPRLLNDRGFDYWESGMDFLQHQDYYESYIDYQSQLLAEFDSMANEFDFHRIDATQKISKVFNTIKKDIETLVKDMKRMEFRRPSTPEYDFVNGEA